MTVYFVGKIKPVSKSLLLCTGSQIASASARLLSMFALRIDDVWQVYVRIQKVEFKNKL